MGMWEGGRSIKQWGTIIGGVKRKATIVIRRVGGELKIIRTFLLLDDSSSFNKGNVIVDCQGSNPFLFKVHRTDLIRRSVITVAICALRMHVDTATDATFLMRSLTALYTFFITPIL